MEIIFITIPITLLFIATGAVIFFWASKGGQFDDLDSPAHKILFDDDIETSAPQKKANDLKDQSTDPLKDDPKANE